RVDVGRKIESPVERAKNPTEDGVQPAADNEPDSASQHGGQRGHAPTPGFPQLSQKLRRPLFELCGEPRAKKRPADPASRERKRPLGQRRRGPLVARTQQQGRQGRAERQRVESRKKRGDGDREGEL